MKKSSFGQRGGAGNCKNRKILFVGNAKDVPISPASGFSLHEDDFLKTELNTYEIENGVLKIRDGKVKMKCSMRVRPERGASYMGYLKARGSCKKGTAYCIYTGTHDFDQKSPFRWNGLMILKISEDGSIRGYWISEELVHHSVFAFGDIALAPVG